MSLKHRYSIRVSFKYVNRCCFFAQRFRFSFCQGSISSLFRGVVNEAHEKSRPVLC